MGITITYKGTLEAKKDILTLFKVIKDYSNNANWSINEETDFLTVFPGDLCDLVYFKINNLVFDDFTKTQFAGIQTHIDIIDLFHSIQRDEGEYWESNDKNILQQLFNDFFIAFEEHKKRHLKAQGPIKLPNGRIVDVME